ncbi:hypothetical protein PPERSA_09432 [Pseudocohnilembus persalinus]|uniref:Uncharacterized protein n=1 Tax=Pseudocohnilembus persalinus TaxID=266149 RepID=A0A0V0Q9R0_PSEPJ|nr:hypothetical protein PPERSA_09432 [Pseudocohnilembus persalinus]|eukprot:KRW98907.1 hypothetical protein PPERSA_09432 [Pseudocohnilembus persalinus]
MFPTCSSSGHKNGQKICCLLRDQAIKKMESEKQQKRKEKEIEKEMEQMGLLLSSSEKKKYQEKMQSKEVSQFNISQLEEPVANLSTKFQKIKEQEKNLIKLQKIQEQKEILQKDLKINNSESKKEVSKLRSQSQQQYMGSSEYYQSKFYKQYIDQKQKNNEMNNIRVQKDKIKEIMLKQKQIFKKYQFKLENYQSPNIHNKSQKQSQSQLQQSPVISKSAQQNKKYENYLPLARKNLKKQVQPSDYYNEFQKIKSDSNLSKQQKVKKYEGVASVLQKIADKEQNKEKTQENILKYDQYIQIRNNFENAKNLKRKENQRKLRSLSEKNVPKNIPKIKYNSDQIQFDAIKVKLAIYETQIDIQNQK